MMKFALVCLGLAVTMITACARQDEAQESSGPSHNCPGYAKNSDGRFLSWQGGFPIKLSIDNSVPSSQYAAISAAVDTWNSQLGTNVFVIIGSSKSNPDQAEDGKNVIYWVTRWNFDTSTQAHTKLRWKNASILEADIFINARDNQFSSRPNGSQFDLQSVIAHELGHVFGLAHDESAESMMQSLLDGGKIRRSASQSDLDHFACVYRRR